MHVCVPWSVSGTCGSQERVTDALKVDVQLFMNHHTLGNKVGSSARAAGALNCWVNSVVHSCSYVFGCAPILQQLSHLSCPTTLNFHCDLKKKGNPMAVPESLAYWIFQTHSPVTLFLRTFLVNALERRPLYSEFLQHLQRLCPYREVSPTFQQKLPEGRVCVYSIRLLLLTVPYAELILNPSMIL